MEPKNQASGSNGRMACADENCKSRAAASGSCCRLSSSVVVDASTVPLRLASALGVIAATPSLSVAIEVSSALSPLLPEESLLPVTLLLSPAGA